MQDSEIIEGLAMKVPFTHGTVGPFGLAVRDPRRSAQWFMRVLGLRKEFWKTAGGGQRQVTPCSPQTIGHMPFLLPSMAVLRKTLRSRPSA